MHKGNICTSCTYATGAMLLRDKPTSLQASKAMAMALHWVIWLHGNLEFLTDSSSHTVTLHQQLLASVFALLTWQVPTKMQSQYSLEQVQQDYDNYQLMLCRGELQGQDRLESARVVSKLICDHLCRLHANTDRWTHTSCNTTSRLASAVIAVNCALYVSDQD